MADKRHFIGAEEHSGESIQRLNKNTGQLFARGQIEVTTVDGQTYVFYGKRSEVFSGPDSDLCAAIGPAGALQVIEKQQWESDGQRHDECDPGSDEIRTVKGEVFRTIVRVFSPSYWQDVSANTFTPWQDQTTREVHFGTGP